MKKSEKLKGKEKVQEKAATHKRQMQIIGVVAVVIIVITGVTAYLTAYNPFVVAGVGDTVNVTYTGMLDNKTVFDTNVNGSQLSFVIGTNTVIPGFDAAVRGMKTNEEKTVTIPADQAYGEYDPELVTILPASKFPANQTLVPGQIFYVKSATTGRVTVITVINVTSAGVAVDANSPLVGQNLTFTIKVNSIKKAASTAATTS